jgi:hypothetical protein
MPFQVRCLTDQRIIIVSVSSPLDALQDSPGMIRSVAELKKLSPDLPVFRILDMSDLTISFGEIVLALAVETRGDPGSFSDPQVIHVVITRDRLVREALEMLEYPGITIMETMSQALNFIYRERCLS